MLKAIRGRLSFFPLDTIAYDINGMQILFGLTEDRRLKLLHFSSAPFDEKELCRHQDPRISGDADRDRRHMLDEIFQPVQVNYSGYDRPFEKQGNKYIATTPGTELRLVSMQEGHNAQGDTLTFTQQDERTGCRVETTWQFYDGLPVIRVSNTVTNAGPEVQTLEYISSFSYWGIEKENCPGDDAFISTDDKMTIVIPHNAWQKELTLKQYRFADLGMVQTQPHVNRRSSKTIEVTNTGNWSSKNYLPLGYIGNSAADTGLFFEIEHNGSWHYEISDQNRHFVLCVSGPTETQSHWSLDLKPGDSFTTVPVAVGVSRDSFEQAMGVLTRYRRLIRRPNADNENLPIIFNDYMNCLFGDPTTEKELPMIDAAAEAGCEYYVIDAGWYDDGSWWDNVGEWKESRARFPGGIREVTDYIRSKGMIPGVWLELEVMGIRCRLSKELPKECFFQRHGRRVFDRSRNQLDFRHPLVIEHANRVIDRVVNEYGVGYIKMDYNIEPGIGTEIGTGVAGDGLLGHERAYLAWLDSVFARYPGLVIENCSSGGMRMDYALLSRCSIQSTSDQEGYAEYATIAMNAPAGVTPEQSAIWSYPQRTGDREEVIYNMVNCLLSRIHQSGHLADLDPERFALVKEALGLYKQIRSDLRTGIPFWPMGFADAEQDWLAGGLRCGDVIYLAVWRRGGEDEFEIELESAFPGHAKQVECIYPAEHGLEYEYDPEFDTLIVKYDAPIAARLYRITAV